MVQYRCLADRLIIRTQPHPDPQYRTPLRLLRGEMIDVVDGRRVDIYGYTWLQHERGWSAQRSLDGQFVFLTDAIRTRDRIWGINIDPNNPKANPLADQLVGTGWVRFVLHVDSRRETLEQAFQFYDPVIQAYSAAGTRIILILLQDMYGGNAPWVRGDWATYIRGFAERAGIVARHYRGQVAAYQIWNEGDASGLSTSIFFPPNEYAGLLVETAKAITLSDPDAQIISGGLATSTRDAIDYLRQVQTACGGVLPIDGIGVHPYGQVPPDPGAAPFSGWATGQLDTYLLQFTNAFPGMPLWITEIGVPRVDVNNQSFWPRIANYMDKTIGFIRSSWSHAVAAVVWFAWGDAMDQAGIVNDSQAPKGILFSTFFNNVHADYAAYTRPDPTPYDGGVMLAHTADDALNDASAGALARRVKTEAPNVTDLLVKATRGIGWIGGNPRIGSPNDLAAWAAEFGRHRIQLHAWHEVSGNDTAAETNLLVALAGTPGVASLVLDLQASRLALRSSAQIRMFMSNLRRLLPAGYHLGVSFDARPENYGAVALAEWFPFIDSWHPRVFHLDYGVNDPEFYLQMLYTAMRPYRRPILPMLQVASADQMRRGVRVATETNGSPGISMWRLGAGGFDAYRGVYIPWFSGFIPTPVLSTLTARTTVRIRAIPSTNTAILGQLTPNTRIDVFERRTLGGYDWVRHRRGWSAARNVATNEVYLS